MIKLFDTVIQKGGSLKIKTELRLIKADVVALTCGGAFPIELVPGIFMALWGWSWWLAGLMALLIETVYIYGSYYTTRWFVVRKEVASQDYLIRWFARKIELVRTTDGDSSFFIRTLRGLARLFGIVYRKCLRSVVRRVIILIQTVIPKLHRDNLFSRSLLNSIKISYGILVTAAGFVPYALRPTVIILALRNEVDDCRFLLIGTAFKLFICSYFGKSVYGKLFTYAVTIYDFFMPIVIKYATEIYGFLESIISGAFF